MHLTTIVFAPTDSTSFPTNRSRRHPIMISERQADFRGIWIRVMMCIQYKEKKGNKTPRYEKSSVAEMGMAVKLIRHLHTVRRTDYRHNTSVHVAQTTSRIV